MQAKLNPQGTAKINFPGFQEILDFTSAGSESSVSVNVSGDTDKEYIIIVRNLDADAINITLNGDTGSNYGYQYLLNSGGTISAARGTNGYIFTCGALAISTCVLLTPTSLSKSGYQYETQYTSGTTIQVNKVWTKIWNNTANVTSITATIASGNFTSGTNITIYARRS